MDGWVRTEQRYTWGLEQCVSRVWGCHREKQGQNSIPRAVASPRPEVTKKERLEGFSSCSSGHWKRSSGLSLPASDDLKGRTSGEVECYCPRSPGLSLAEHRKSKVGRMGRLCGKLDLWWAGSMANWMYGRLTQ